MTQATRTEEDLLGAREVPLEAYWGIHTLRAMENFRISGSVVGDEEAFVRGMVQVKKASALANSDLGALDPEVAGAIVWACDQVLWGAWCFSDWGSFSSRESIGWIPCQQRNTQKSSRRRLCAKSSRRNAR